MWTLPAASSYILEISRDTPGNVVRTYEGLTDTTFTPAEELNRLPTYYYRVRGVTAEGAGPWSEYWSFTTRDAR